MVFIENSVSFSVEYFFLSFYVVLDFLKRNGFQWPFTVFYGSFVLILLEVSLLEMRREFNLTNSFEKYHF